MSSQNLSEFYPASKGLGVCHLFCAPVELIALGNKFEFRDERLTSNGGKKIPPPDSVRAILRRYVVGRLVPKHLQYLVATSRGFHEPCTKYEVVQAVSREYFFTREVFELMELREGVSHSMRRYLRSQCQLTGVVFQQVLKELTLQDMSAKLSNGSKENRTHATAYFRRLAWLRSMLATFDAVCMGLQQARRTGWYPNSVTRRALGRLKHQITLTPFNVALDLKDLAFEARNYYFGGDVPSGPHSTLLTGMTRREALGFSYIARALPAPLEELIDKDRHLDELRDRFTSEPKPVVEGWRAWIAKYWGDHYPREVVVQAQPSTSGCLGRPRHHGGHRTAYSDIILYELYQRFEDKPLESLHHKLRRMNKQTLAALDYAPPNRNIAMSRLASWAELSAAETEALNELFLAGCKRIVRQLPILPVAPVIAPEKGMKTRIPTSSLTAANILQQALRSAADCFLRADPRVSKSLGGKLPNKLPAGPYLSQDMTVATDMHEFWMTQTAYEELINFVPELDDLREFLPKLLGPKYVITSKLNLEAPDRSIIVDAEPLWLQQQPKFPRNVFFKSGFTPETIKCSQVNKGDLFNELLKRIQLSSPRDWADPKAREKILAPRPKAPPRRAGGFSSEQRANLHTAEISREEFDLLGPILESLIEFGREYSDWLESLLSLEGYTTRKGEMMGDPTSWALLPLVTLYATDSLGYHSVKTCGDDAVIARFHGDVNDYYSEVEKLGAVISRKKTFFHTTKSLFTEEVSKWNGHECKKLRRVHIPLWVGPPGGSKGQVNWYNLPTSVSSLHAGWTLSKYSRFHSEYRAAYRLGIPLGAPVFMGGINHPKYGYTPCRDVGRWLDTLSSLTVKHLLLSGGLTLMPSPREDDEVEFVWAFLRGHLTKEPGIPIADALVQLRNLPGIRGIFLRRYTRIVQTPSVWNLSRKLKRRIMRAPFSGKVGKPLNVYHDLLFKQTYFIDVKQLPEQTLTRNFGISKGRVTAWDVRPKDAANELFAPW
jgi:hypothetical protein